MKQIIKASMDDVETIRRIVHETIMTEYPHYYPMGAVQFFDDHHSSTHIRESIQKERAYLLLVEGQAIGTVTIDGQEINRLFVLPAYQGKGYGRSLIEFAEEEIFKQYDRVVLSASLSAKHLYAKNGYIEIGYYQIATAHGDYLCYDYMEKHRKKVVEDYYDGRTFMTYTNTDNGEVSTETIFHYHQNGKQLWAEYEGGEIIKGYLIGFVEEDNKLRFSYQHINSNQEIRIGQCQSYPEVLPDGKLMLHESWQWLNGDGSKGNSQLIEVIADEEK